MRSEPTLLLDLGNTRLKLARAIGGRLLQVQAIEHRQPGFEAQLRAVLSAGPQPTECWLAAVTPDVLTERIAAALPEHRRVRVQAEFGGLRIAYREPDRLGVDRWLAMLAALHECAGPRLVVSAGTALTIDAVDSDGRHLGGLICPGIAPMQQALRARAPHLPPVPEATGQPVLELADDTVGAIFSGAWQAAAGVVDRSLYRWQQRIGTEIGLLLCGGDAGQLARLIERPCLLRPDLVLQGLARYVEAARGAGSVESDPDIAGE